MVCKTGCFCKQGYVRESNKTGRSCIKREQCKTVNTQTCGENEEYSSCGSLCPVTCDNLSYSLPKPIKRCPTICIRGCFCKPGFYRRNDGKCVKQQECCGKNEIFTDCGTACPETCEKKTEICTEQCVAGCFCHNTGYVRMNNNNGSPCILRDQCPKS